MKTESPDGRINYPSREFQIPDAETHGLEIVFSGVPLAGIVVDKETDQPIAQASVERALRNHSADKYGSSQTGADGRFQLDADPGDYTLTGGAEGYASGRISAVVGWAGLFDARIELEKGVEIEGRIVDSSGQGVSFPSRSWPHRRPGEGDPGFAQALPDGSFRLSPPRRAGLQPLRWEPTGRLRRPERCVAGG